MLIKIYRVIRFCPTFFLKFGIDGGQQKMYTSDPSATYCQNFISKTGWSDNFSAIDVIKEVEKFPRDLYGGFKMIFDRCNEKFYYKNI
jgi:hypothetical protein